MSKLSRVSSATISESSPFRVRSCFFHGTPVLERRRRNHWDSASSFRSSPRNFNQYSKRLRKHALLRNVSEFAEHMFQQSWKSDRDEHEQPSGRNSSSWFRPSFREDGYKRGKLRSWGPRANKRDFEFCHDSDDDVEFETILRSGFGGRRFFYWSFTKEDEPQYWSSSSYPNNYRTGSGWKCEYEEEYDTSSQYNWKSMPDITSDRLALGLSASGPLKLEDVKIAYRACALKWHPDRHQGASKVVAEEKFKACSAAYQSLCNKLALQ